jgi:16S rRNA (cytosine967-C5)-methyltransferase
VHELVYGVERFRGRIDHLLSLHLHRGLGALEPEIRTLLRLGSWQLLAMGSVPTYAAVGETVAQARHRKPGAAGLVNAVLRRLSEEGGGEERFPDPAEDPVGWLSTWGSHPRWLVERWMGRFGFEETRVLVEANNRIPGTHLRRLTDGTTEPLEPGADVGAALEAAHPAIVQDPAASAVTDFAASGLAPGDRVADLCAAPGGKALGLAGLGARVLALDRSVPRLARVRENAARTGYVLEVAAALGEAPPLAPGSVARVLVDAPCTGTGTLARHPDARWHLEPGAPAALAVVQDRILDGAAGILGRGGILVYSTCTLEPEENEARVAAFTARHPDFVLEETLELLPHRTGSDGAFAARLRRADTV